MGWGRGSEVFSGVIEAAKKHFPDATQRKAFYEDVYSAFKDNDWDTESDCFRDDPVFEEWYCNMIGTLPQRKQQDLAIQIFDEGIKKEDVKDIADVVALDLEDTEEIVEEIWYYVEEIQEDGIDVFREQYELN